MSSLFDREAALAFLLAVAGTWATAGLASAQPAQTVSSPSNPQKVDEAKRLFEEMQRAAAEGQRPAAIAAGKKLLPLQRELEPNAYEGRIRLLSMLADLYHGQGSLNEEKAARQEVLTLRETAHGKQDWRVHDARLALYDVTLADRQSPAQRRQLDESRQSDAQASARLGEGKFAEAIELLEQGAAARKAILGEQHRLYLDSLNYLAVVYQKSGDPARAEPLLRQVVEARKKILGESHPDYAQSLQNLAVWLGEQNQVDQAEPLIAQALAVRRKALGEEDPRCAETLAAWALLRAKLKDFARAAELYYQAAAIVSHAYGEESLEFADSLKPLADMYYEMRMYGKAEPLYRRIAGVRQKALGQSDPSFLDALAELALLYADMGEKAKSEPLAQALLSESQRVFGEQSPQYAQRVEEAAHIYYQLKDDERGNALVKQLLTIQKQVLGQKDEQYLRSLGTWGNFYRDRGDAARAEQLYREALDTIKQEYGEKVPAYAEVLRRLAMLRESQGDAAAAGKMLREAIALTKDAGREQSSQYRDFLFELAKLHYRMKDDTQADVLQQETIDWSRKVNGGERLDLAETLGFWAHYHRQRGDYARALPLGRQAVEICRTALGEQHIGYARILNQLAQIYQGMGDPKTALPLLEQAAEIVKRVEGEMHFEYARILDELGLAQLSLNDASRAADTLQQSLDIRRKILGEGHVELAQSLYSQAVLYHSLKVYDQAEPLYRQALEIFEKQESGTADKWLADVLSSYSNFYHDQGDYAHAEQLLRRALDVQRRSGVEQDSSDMENLARLCLAQKQFDQANSLALDAVHLARRKGNLTAAVQSERQQLGMAQQLRRYLDTYLSAALAAKAPPETIYSEVLAWKGAVFSQQRLQRLRGRALAGDASKSTSRLLTQLEQKSRELASQARIVPTPGLVDVHRDRVKQLSDEIEQLQGELAALEPQAARLTPSSQPTPAALRRLLPEGVLLIDVLEFRDFVPATDKDLPGYESRVLVFMLRADKPLAVISLGAADRLATAVNDWRQAVGKSPCDADNPGAELRRLAWEPMAEYTAGCATILISPDGALARFPWGALPGAKPGSYLLEDHAFATMPVAQSLDEVLAARKPGADADAALLLVGDVEFGASPGQPAPDKRVHKRAAPRSATQSAGWKELPGTHQETAAITSAFEQAFGQGKLKSLARDQATEDQVRNAAPRSRYLHLATHGFFSAPAEQSQVEKLFGAVFEGAAVAETLMSDSEDKKQKDPDRIETSRSFNPDRGITGLHPGLLSGIVLAGANAQVEPDRDDGVLTALEVGELDLSRVELVTLSACETGLGESAGGEGLLGLQRAFQVAGASSVVASLWQVPDDATRALMTEFYQNLWSKRLSKIESLRRAQLAILRRYDPRSGVLRGLSLESPQIPARPAGSLPPLYWAAFVLSGDWR